jgi:hypothetical protein
MCPDTVWMDVDWHGGIERSAQVLKYKALLAQHGVGFGVLLSGDPLSTTTSHLPPHNSTSSIG